MSYNDKQVLMTPEELANYRRALDVFDDLQSDDKNGLKQRKTAITDTLPVKVGKVKRVKK